METRQPLSREAAQAAVARIEAFREELARLDKAGVLRLNPEQRQAVDQHQAALLAQWRQRFDVDTENRERQLSWGMKVASFLAALALSAAVFFLCYQFWGQIPTAAQAALLFLFTLATSLASLHCAAREQSSYFAKLFGMIACVCFALNMSLLGRMFNLTPRPTVFLVWSGFAFLLAYACEARLLLAVGICALSAWLGAQTGTFWGMYWLGFGQYPETFFPAALALFGLSLIPHYRQPDFPPAYRVWALLFWFLPVLLLSHWGEGSLFPMSHRFVEYLYQLTGFASAALLMVLGIRHGWPETVKTSVVFFTLFLYTKFFDWWWDWMPKSLFFLVLGLAALLALLILRRLRRLHPHAREVQP